MDALPDSSSILLVEIHRGDSNQKTYEESRSKEDLRRFRRGRLIGLLAREVGLGERFAGGVAETRAVVVRKGVPRAGALGGSFD